MSNNLPPGTSPGDPNAPWNDNRPECPDCSRRIGDEEDHERECPIGHLDGYEVEEARRESHSLSWDEVKDDPDRFDVGGRSA